MLAHVQICNIILQLLLFGLLLYKLSDLMRSYGVPWLKDEMVAESRSHLQLIEKDRYLNASQKKITQQIEEQKHLFATLEKNASAVEHFIFEKRARERLEFDAIAEKIMRKRLIQEQNNHLTKQCEEVFTIALQQTRNELRTHFIEKHDSKHLDVVINYLPQLHPHKD